MYESKLEEFERFVREVLLFSQLGVTSRSASTPSTAALSPSFVSSTLHLDIRPTLVVIDDLPHAGGALAQARLRACLATLTQSSRVPVVIILVGFSSSFMIV